MKVILTFLNSVVLSFDWLALFLPASEFHLTSNVIFSKVSPFCKGFMWEARTISLEEKSIDIILKQSSINNMVLFAYEYDLFTV